MVKGAQIAIAEAKDYIKLDVQDDACRIRRTA